MFKIDILNFMLEIFTSYVFVTKNDIIYVKEKISNRSLLCAKITLNMTFLLSTSQSLIHARFFYTKVRLELTSWCKECKENRHTS